MGAGRRLSRRCVNRGAATTHSPARTSEWPRLPPLAHKMARATIGPASGSTTRGIVGSNSGMIRIIPTGRVFPTTMSANRRITRKIIRIGRPLLATSHSRSPIREITRTSPRLPITPANRRATCKTIRIARPLRTPADSRRKAINPAIRRQGRAATGHTTTVLRVRGRTTQTPCRR